MFDGLLLVQFGRVLYRPVGYVSWIFIPWLYGSPQYSTVCSFSRFVKTNKTHAIFLIYVYQYLFLCWLWYSFFRREFNMLHVSRCSDFNAILRVNRNNASKYYIYWKTLGYTNMFAIIDAVNWGVFILGDFLTEAGWYKYAEKAYTTALKIIQRNSDEDSIISALDCCAK